MQCKTLKIAAPQQLSMFFHLRGKFQLTKALCFFLVLSCTLFSLTTCEPCPVNGMLKSAGYDECESYVDDQGVGLQEIIVGDTTSGYVTGTSKTQLLTESICTNSHSFCFPSTLPGFLPNEHKLKAAALEVSRSQSGSAFYVESTKPTGQATNNSWSSDRGMFKLLNGRTVSCSLNSRDGIPEFSSILTDSSNQNDLSSCRGPLLNQKSNVRLNRNKQVAKSGSFDVSSSPNIEINPPILDWGQKYLFSPSVAYLAVANTCNDSLLHVYEPFSTSLQFYPCNFSEILLGPGEVASICFVYLPRWLGFSSAHLILQTSSGGFLVQARGFAVESPYEIQPLVGLDAPSSRQFSRNLSLFNPFDETVYVEEITAWISVSMGSATHHTEAICSIGNIQGYSEHSFLSVEDWLVIEGVQGSPLISVRPYRNWEIKSHSRETILEINLSFSSEGQIIGAFCMQLVRPSQDQSDAVMVPLEVDLDRKASYDDIASSVSVAVEALVPNDGSKTGAVAISLRNAAPYMLSVLKISEVADTNIFHIKYMEGLLLFPGAVTQVSVITCTQLVTEIHDYAPEVSNINRCKLLILTNDSISPQIEVLCKDIVHICLKHQKDSSIGHEYQSEKVESGHMRIGSSGGGMQLVKGLGAAEADELVLGNWKSQGTTTGLSVLDDHEVVFPMVQVGTFHSKWITVRNPSKQPVVMQLILHSGEIIDECRGQDGFRQPLSSGSFAYAKSAVPMRYGFSIAEGALTEAFVHPYGKASFGPILFHPSKRCGWRSSALIRNNLSGVEWLSLRGFGGSLSVVLLEGSEPIQSIEFNLNLPIPLNLSLPYMFFRTEDTTYACSQPFSKQLFAKNTGDLPLKVRHIEVSGMECGLDGFVVHTCKGFSLEPGESKKLLISYQTDFSAAVIHRDLELALATGIIVIPMKASLPVYVLNLCKKSVFWMRLKKLFVAVLLSAFLLFVVFCCIFPQVMIFSYHDHFYKSEKSPVITIGSGGKSSRAQRNRKFSGSTEMNSLLNSVREEKLLKQAPNGRYTNGEGRTLEHRLTAGHGKPIQENDRQINSLLDTQGESPLPSLLPKSVTAENPDVVEPPHSGNLTISIGKEKGRRRRKRKVAAAGVTALIEVSSSQSGNSTPSSPLSPVTSVTPNRPWSFTSDADQSSEVRHPFTQLTDQTCGKGQVSELVSKENVLESKVSVKPSSSNLYISTQEQISASQKNVPKPVLMPCATFPSTSRVSSRVPCSSPSLASTSSVAPHARAPGSKLCNQENNKAEGKAILGSEYTYDIWGDHFSGLLSMGRSKDVVAMNSTSRDNDSFFVKGPQILMKKSEPRPVSCLQQEG